MTREEHARRPRRESLRKRRPALARQVMARDAHTCVYCASPATTLDHLEPRSQGGLDEASNLVAACLRCNSARRHRSLVSWQLRAFGLGIVFLVDAVRTRALR
jgi:5-methylcytosine-specific restriction endonuclease McrA